MCLNRLNYLKEFWFLLIRKNYKYVFDYLDMYLMRENSVLKSYSYDLGIFLLLERFVKNFLCKCGKSNESWIV